MPLGINIMSCSKVTYVMYGNVVNTECANVLDTKHYLNNLSRAFLNQSYSVNICSYSADAAFYFYYMKKSQVLVSHT